MIRPIRFSVLAAFLLFATIASAQQAAQQTPQQLRSYDVRREASVQGTVVSFTENSSTPPLGAHVSIQTSSGVLDVHLGDASLLRAAHLTLAPGDSVRVIGESLLHGSGTQYFARIIQKGNQAVALRSPRGFPLRPVPKAGQKQAGVL
jgi:hypothetical protein